MGAPPAGRRMPPISARLALREGAERLRIAVTSCSAVAAGSAGLGDGAYADLAPATAERVFEVAGDVESQIDKLRMLQSVRLQYSIECKGV